MQQAICSPMEVVSFWSSNWRGTTASLDRKRFRLHSAISLGEQDDYLAKDLLVRSRIGSRTHMPCRGAAAHRQARQHGGGRANDRLPQRNDGGDPNSTRWPSGHVVVDNVYATYQYPVGRRYPYPILFNSGGGHTARVYDTTPDGREGWLTLFVREGFAVYGVDRPNTGRSGTDICKINAVKLGKTPASELPAINRYAAVPPGSPFAGARNSASLIPTPSSQSNSWTITIRRP